MKLHGKSVIAGNSTDSTAGFFSARGNLARFEEATAGQVHQAFDETNLAFPRVSRDFLREACGLPGRIANSNTRGIWRLVDGQLTREPLQYAG